MSPKISCDLFKLKTCTISIKVSLEIGQQREHSSKLVNINIV